MNETSGDTNENKRPTGSSTYTPGQARAAAAAATKEKLGAMEVLVEHNIEKAIKVLKRKMIKEGIFRELKSRRYYEKPSERRKRKTKESIKKIRKEQARSKKNLGLLF